MPEDAAIPDSPTVPPEARGDVEAAAPGLQAPDLSEDNPFAEEPAPATATPPAGRVPLPAAFASISEQLPEQAKAKLKACDVTTAQIVLQRELGAETEPMKLASFMGRDFAHRCAQRLGGDGFITCTVIDKKLGAFTFAFEYHAAGELKADPLQAQRELLNAYLAEFKRIAEDVKMEAALGGSGRGRGNDTRELLREMKELGLIGGQQQNGNGLKEAVELLAAVNNIGRQTTEASIAQLLSGRELLEKLGAGKPVEKSAAQELKEILEIGPVKDVTSAVTQAAVKRILTPADKSATPEATGKPGDVAGDNPFAEAV